MANFLSSFWWLWICVGLVLFVIGMVSGFKKADDVSSSLSGPVVLNIVGGFIFWLGIACFVGPWLVRHFGHQ